MVIFAYFVEILFALFDHLTTLQLEEIIREFKTKSTHSKPRWIP